MKAKTDWDEFVRACKNCTGCGLAKNRNNVVIGRGTNLSAKIMLIGEGRVNRRILRTGFCRKSESFLIY